MDLTQALGRMIAEADRRAIGKDALDVARMGIMDAVATAYAGADEPAARIAAQYAQRRAIEGAAYCRLPWDARPLPAPMAALVFGAAAHALDYDDVALGGHPSTVLAPVVLSEGLARGLPGRACLQAYVVGYQAWAEMFRREADPLHPKGWHPTAMYGVVAGAAALAYLRGLPAQQAASALGLAASLASGLVANFGTMTKPLHAGRAASLAFDALEFSGMGLTSSPDVLEHRAGFLHAISQAGRVDRDLPLADDWLLPRYGLCIKKYPACYSGHRVIDAVIALANQHDLRPEQVREVRVGLGPSQLSMLRNPAPQTELEAKFSIQFAVAAALDARAVGLAQLSDDYVRKPAVQALFGRVQPYIIDEPDPEDPTFSVHDEVHIVLEDGRELASGPVRTATGHAYNPLSDAELQRKFEDCVGRRASAATPPAVLAQRMLALAECPDVGQLFAPA